MPESNRKGLVKAVGRKPKKSPSETLKIRLAILQRGKKIQGSVTGYRLRGLPAIVRNREKQKQETTSRKAVIRTRGWGGGGGRSKKADKVTHISIPQAGAQLEAEDSPARKNRKNLQKQLVKGKRFLIPVTLEEKGSKCITLSKTGTEYEDRAN